MPLEVGTPLRLDVGPALQAIDRITAADSSFRAEQLKTSASVTSSYAEMARQATAYSDNLKRQQDEVRAAATATRSAAEEVRRLTAANQELATASKKANNADEVKRLQGEIAKNTAKIKEAKQAILENRAATDQERQAVEAVREARRQEVNQTKLATAAAKDLAAATKQEAVAAKEAAAASKQTDAGLSIGKSAGGFLGSLKALGPAVVAAFSIEAIKNFASNVNEASKTLDSIKSKLNFATGSPEAAGRELSFLRNEANRLGLDLSTTALSYGSFVAAAKEGNVPLAEARRTFLAVSGATASLKLSAADTQGVLLALQQIVSKGTVSAEELRGQIGERLPGAFSIAARAIGVTEQQLNKLLQSGSVVSAEFLPKFTRELEKTFGDGSEAAADALQANENRINNEWQAFLLRFEGLAGSTLGVVAKFAAQANKFLDSFTTAGRLRQASQGAQQGIKDYGDTLDALFQSEAERAKKNGEDTAKAVERVATQQAGVLQKQLADAQQELAKFNTSTKEGALFQGNFRGGSAAFNAARQEALRRVELIKGEQAAIGERAAAFKQAADGEATQAGRIIALRALIAANTKTRDETKDTKEGNAERVRLNALLKEENKLLDELLGKEEKVRKARQYSYEAQLRALLNERQMLTSLAAKASEKLADDAAGRARAVFDEALRQVGVVQAKLEQRELDLRKAAAKVGGGAVTRLGEKADGVVDGKQEEALTQLRLAAIDAYYRDLYAITAAREQRLFDLRADSDAKEIEAVERKYDRLLGFAKDAIERTAVEEARAREQVALRAAQEQRRIDQTARAAAANANTVGATFGEGTGISIIEAKRAEQQALLDIEKKAAEDSLNNTLNRTGKEAEIERAALRAQLARIQQQQVALNAEKSRIPAEDIFFKAIFGEQDSDENREKLGQIVGTFKDALLQTTQAAIQAADAKINAYDRSIAELSNSLAAEIQLNQAGSASNIKGIQDQIAEEKQARRDAINEKKRAQKEEAVINGLQQASALATAAANLILGWSTLPLVGQVLGALSVAAMLASFLDAKSTANSAAQASFFKGGVGTTGYTGDGNPHDESRELGRKGYTYHRQEYILPHEVTQQFRHSLLEPLHKGEYHKIDWSGEHMKALLPDLELPDKLAAEKRAYVEHNIKMSAEPLRGEFDRMHARLEAIESTNLRMADKPDRVPLGPGRFIEVSENGSTHTINVG